MRRLLTDDKTKNLLIDIAAVGTLVVAVADPTFITPAVVFARHWKQQNAKQKKQLRDSFNNLRRKGYFHFESKYGKTYIALTRKGAEQAKTVNLFNKLKPKKSQKWDGKWRMLMFDIPSEEKAKRDALRFFIKRMGFVQLQKSVWVYPFDCREEYRLLSEFFTLPQESCRLITATDIGEEKRLKNKFELS